MSRAEKVHHRERLKEKRKDYFCNCADTERSLGIVINTPKRCSCPMCGNPRKYFKGEGTMQEKKAFLKEKENE